MNPTSIAVRTKEAVWIGSTHASGWLETGAFLVAWAGPARIRSLLDALGLPMNAADLLDGLYKLLLAEAWEPIREPGKPLDYGFELLVVEQFGGLWKVDGTFASTLVPLGTPVAIGPGDREAVGAYIATMTYAGNNAEEGINIAVHTMHRLLPFYPPNTEHTLAHRAWPIEP